MGHELRVPARTGCGGVSMAGGLQGQGQGRGEGVMGRCLPSPLYIFKAFTYVVRHSVSVREVDSEYPFYMLIYMNFYVFHIYFILFIFLSKTY